MQTKIMFVQNIFNRIDSTYCMSYLILIAHVISNIVDSHGRDTDSWTTCHGPANTYGPLWIHVQASWPPVVQFTVVDGTHHKNTL